MPASPVLPRSSAPGSSAVPTARGLAAGGPLQDWMAADGEVMDMRRYLLVLDMDLLALDEELDLEPINYLVAQQVEEQERGEVVVLSLVATRQAKLSPLELVLGAATGR